jgi:hypothetical protein
VTSCVLEKAAALSTGSWTGRLVLGSPVQSELGDYDEYIEKKAAKGRASKRAMDVGRLNDRLNAQTGEFAE